MQSYKPSHKNHHAALQQHALWQAAKAGNLNLMRKLIIQAKANPFLPDYQGMSTFDYALAAHPKGYLWVSDILSSLREIGGHNAQ